jgi:hypothetical protein
MLRPEGVRVTSSRELVRAYLPGFCPAAIAGPVEHRARGDQGTGRAPHDVVGIRVGIGQDVFQQAVGELAVTGEAPGDHEDAALPGKEPCLAALGKLDARHDVGLALPGGQRRPRRAGQVERRLRTATTPQRVERPDHAGGAHIERLQRLRRPPAVPLVGRPQRRRIVSGVDIVDDRPDRVAHATLVPGLVGERLERVRPIQHLGRSLENAY